MGIIPGLRRQGQAELYLKTLSGKRGTETGEDDRGRGKKEGIPFEVEKGEEKKKADETKNPRNKQK